MGDAIDKFPYVARFNTFRIHGYQQYVGTKCDVWIAVDNFPDWQGYYNYKEVYYCNPKRQRDGVNPKYERFKADIPSAKLFPDWVWDEVSSAMKAHPSSGAVAAYYFSKSYDRVYLYGFDCFQAAKHHYGDNLSHCHHKADKERAFIEKLKSQGVVRDFNNYTYLHDHDSGYGSGGAFGKEILTLEPTSVLDYGCGKGSLVRYLNCHKVPSVGYDPYVFLYHSHPRMQPDMLVSTDVLEHLEKDMLDEVLSDMLNYRPRLMFHVVSNRPAVQILPDGTNAHKIIQSPDWWLNKLQQAFSNYVTGIHKHNERQNFTIYISRRK